VKLMLISSCAFTLQSIAINETSREPTMTDDNGAANKAKAKTSGIKVFDGRSPLNEVVYTLV